MARRRSRGSRRGATDLTPILLLGGLAAVGGAAWYMSQIHVGDTVRVDLSKLQGLPAAIANMPTGTLKVTATTADAVQGNLTSVTPQGGQPLPVPGGLPIGLSVPREAVTGKV